MEPRTEEITADYSREFMSRAAHQLRTPLTTLRWALGILERNLASDPDNARLVGQAKTATMRMHEAIDTMLRVSRAECGMLTIKTAAIPLKSFLQEIMEHSRMAVPEKEVVLHLDCDDGLLLKTDAAFLKEIMSNLLDNALKYTPAGGRIALRTRATGDRMIIHVEDSGFGIPEAQHKHIFTKFFRADSAIQNDTDGIGLGLYLVYLLTDLLGGEISFLSAENKGTTFTLSLPHTPPQIPRENADQE